MFLTGTYPRNLDEKCRFTLPKSVRDSLGPAVPLVLYVAPGTDGSLVLYTEAAFQRLGEQLEEGSPTSHDVRAFSRLFYAQAQRVEPDRQGRIRLPSDLTAQSLQGREIVLIGVRDHWEVWDRQRWQGYLAQKQPFYDEIAENAFGGAPRAAPEEQPATVRPR